MKMFENGMNGSDNGKRTDNGPQNLQKSPTNPTPDRNGDKRRGLFTLAGDRSPLWTTLTHAQTITEFIES